MTTTRSASRVAMEEQVELLTKKLEGISKMMEETTQQQCTRLDEMDRRFHMLEKHVTSLCDEIQVNSSRIQGTEDRGPSSSGISLAKSQQKPIPFDGAISWEAYKLQFEMLSEMNGWDSSDRASYLAMPCHGCVDQPATRAETRLPCFGGCPGYSVWSGTSDGIESCQAQKQNEAKE